MSRWFPLKNEILYDYSIKPRTKIVLAILYLHQNNNHIITITCAKLNKLLKISNSNRYLKELIELKYVKLEDSKYKLNYNVNCKKDSKDKYSKIKYEHIYIYTAENIINQCIIENIIRIQKLSLNNVDLTMFLKHKSDISPWNTIEEVNTALNALKEKEMIHYNVSIKLLANITEMEQEKTAHVQEEQKAEIMVPDNIIQNNEQKDNNFNNLNEFFGEDRLKQLIKIASKNKIEVNEDNLLILHEYKEKAKKDGTAEFLIEYFYKITNQLNTLKNIPSYVKKLEALIKTKGYKQTKYLIEYAVYERNINTLNFIDNLYEQAYHYIKNKIKDEKDDFEAKGKNAAMELKKLKQIVENIKEEYGEQSQEYEDIKTKYNNMYNEYKILRKEFEELENIMKEYKNNV